jgi:DNA-binding CsgD family transcriptional regulator
MNRLDARVDDKLSRFTPPYKKLVHFIAQGMSDEQCAVALKASIERTQRAVKEAADTLGISEGSYAETREKLKSVGRIFFGYGVMAQAPIKKKPILLADDAPGSISPSDFEELVMRVIELTPRDRERLRVSATMGWSTPKQARFLGVAPSSLSSILSNLYKKIGINLKQSKANIKARNELMRRVFEEMRAKEGSRSIR